MPLNVWILLRKYQYPPLTMEPRYIRLSEVMLTWCFQPRHCEDAYQDGEDGEVNRRVPGDEGWEVDWTRRHRFAVSKLIE